MKKIICLMLCIIMLLPTLAACSEEEAQGVKLI